MSTDNKKLTRFWHLFPAFWRESRYFISSIEETSLSDYHPVFLESEGTRTFVSPTILKYTNLSDVHDLIREHTVLDWQQVVGVILPITEALG